MNVERCFQANWKARVIITSHWLYRFAGIQIKTDECEARKQIILIYRVEIAVPIKDRLCRSALNMRSNACCHCTRRWWKNTDKQQHREIHLHPLKHCFPCFCVASRPRCVTNPTHRVQTKSKPYPLLSKSSIFINTEIDENEEKSTFTTHEKNAIAVYPAPI